MSSSARNLQVDGDADCGEAGMVSTGDLPSVLRPIAVVLGAAWLAGCAQSSVVTNRSDFVATGRASYYSEGSHTASGEKFDAHELTAAHPTLPFGTRLRVTNVATGRSVTVRVNDRGPFVRGRDVDVSYSAAEALGMVGQGVANVKLEVER